MQAVVMHETGDPDVLTTRRPIAPSPATARC